jgi:dihydrofolate synthase/folylpolyglutamate synthase
MTSTQHNSIGYLYDLEQFGVKLGLENIRVLQEALGFPDQSFTSIVVAGTNGKGSVAAMLDTALRSAGYTTGRFTSPHLVNLEERFYVHGTPVPYDELVAEVDHLRATVSQLLMNGKLLTPPTFFEATTAIALSLFRNAGVRVAVLEVGMGGRFDATNVVTPTAVAIPSIDLDHQQYLGTTLAEIAFEKAGVIKTGSLVIVGETQLEAVEVIRQACHERASRLVETMPQVKTSVGLRNGLTELDMTTPIRSYGPIRLGLRGRHQVRNAVVAVRLLEELEGCGLPVSEEAILEGLVNTRWRGRLELISLDTHRSILLDAAHNVASAAAFAAYVDEVWPKGVPLIFAALKDKDISGMIRALGTSATIIVCPPLTSHRALAPKALVRKAKEVNPNLTAIVAPTLHAALEIAWRQGNVIGAAGSIYLIGALMSELALQP